MNRKSLVHLFTLQYNTGKLTHSAAHYICIHTHLQNQIPLRKYTDIPPLWRVPRPNDTVQPNNMSSFLTSPPTNSYNKHRSDQRKPNDD